MVPLEEESILISKMSDDAMKYSHLNSFRIKKCTYWHVIHLLSDAEWCCWSLDNDWILVEHVVVENCTLFWASTTSIHVKYLQVTK